MAQVGKSVSAAESEQGRRTLPDPSRYDRAYVLTVAKEHRRDLILAHLVALDRLQTISIEDPVIIQKILTHLESSAPATTTSLPKPRAPPQASLFNTI